MIPVRQFLKLSAAETTARAEEEFFASIMARNRTYKTTFRGRFAEVDDALASLLARNIISAKNILDIGISSGISTLELYEKLYSSAYNTRIVGTDLLLDAQVVSVFPGCYAIVDDTGFPLRFDILQWGIKPWATKRDYYTGMVILRKSINWLFSYRARRVLKCASSSAVESIQLVTPRLLQNECIHVSSDNIGTYNPKYAAKFDFVRAANLLNLNYFTEADLKAMLANVKSYLRGVGSCVLVIRTHEDHTNHGTLYRLCQGGCFERVLRFGNGSEIDSLIVSA